MKEKINSNKTILVLILLIVLLLASTYAWFTNNSNVNVTGMNVSVESASSIEVSADKTNYYTKIDWTQIEDGNNDEIKPENDTLVPVSTITAGGPFYMHNPIEGNESVANITSIEPSKELYKFTLHFKTSKATNMSLESFSIGDGNEDILNAFRIGTVAGETGSVKNIISKSGEKYNGMKAEIPSSEKVSFVNGIVTDTTYIQEVTPIQPSATSWALEAETPYTITFYIWLEGQDPDCVDANSNLTGKEITLKFKDLSESGT